MRGTGPCGGEGTILISERKTWRQGENDAAWDLLAAPPVGSRSSVLPDRQQGRPGKIPLTPRSAWAAPSEARLQHQ